MKWLSSFQRISQFVRNRHLISSFLENQELFQESEEESLWGSVTDREEEALKRLVQKAALHSGPIIEIGTLFGLTTQLIASAKEPTRKLITVDNYSWNPFAISPAHHLKFTHRALRTCKNLCNVEIFDGDNVTFYRQYQGERPSMIFIDAQHTYEGISVDLQWAVERNIPVICGHDYSLRWPGVMRAVDECFNGELRLYESLWSRSDSSNPSAKRPDTNKAFTSPSS